MDRQGPTLQVSEFEPENHRCLHPTEMIGYLRARTLALRYCASCTSDRKNNLDPPR